MGAGEALALIVSPASVTVGEMAFSPDGHVVLIDECNVLHWRTRHCRRVPSRRKAGLMAHPGEAGAVAASWRERAVERSLRNARAKALSRSDRFIQVAMELLSETGRTDFTVQELVERSRTSLRSFYQHFASKDELLLALFEEVIRISSDEWRRQVDEQDDCVAGLESLVLTMYAQAIEPTMGGVPR